MARYFIWYDNESFPPSPTLAEMHEKAHQQCSISGTSSLFRMGYATMIDSTKKGSIARSIYHCCMVIVCLFFFTRVRGPFFLLFYVQMHC